MDLKQDYSTMLIYLTLTNGIDTIKNEKVKHDLVSAQINMNQAPFGFGTR